MIIAASLLLISSVPVMSATPCNMAGMHSADMDMASVQMLVEPVTQLVDWGDCYIECGCRVDNHLDGMPHQLAPHVLSVAGFDGGMAVSDAGRTVAATLIAKHLFFPPPPKIS